LSFYLALPFGATVN